MYYFAWISDGSVEFGPEHMRVDEHVFTYKIEQTESEFATLTVEIHNPKIGVLAPSREQWAWFSKSTETGAIPLFKGRISSIPADLDREVMTLEFLARPSDYATRKATLASALKVAPYFDPIWIPAENDDDPDTALEGRSALWHIDRVSHEVTISDYNSGEDGVLVFDPSSIFDDSVSVTFGSLPVDTIKMTAKVSWDQAAKRTIDISRKVAQGFGGSVCSYTGQGLQKTWPLENDSIGGDWSFGPCTLKLLSGASVGARFIDCSIQPAPPTMTDPVTARFYLWEFGQMTTVKCDTSRSRTETITFTATADVQTFKSTETPDPLELSYDSERIVEAIDEGGALPIGSVARRSYFDQARGKRSIDFLMCVVRANFMKSARAVEIEFKVPIESPQAITLRADAIIQHPNLPGGGIARGKIISYAIECDGDSGEEIATIRIGCTLGKGNTLASPADGVPVYDEGDYGIDYEAYVGAERSPLAGQIVYSGPDIRFGEGGTAADDGMNLETMGQDEIVSAFVVVNPSDDQAAVLFRGSDTIDNAISALNAICTKCQLTLVPLNTGPFDNTFPLTVDAFAVPKTLDLET